MQEKSLHTDKVSCRLVLIDSQSLRIMTISSDSGPILPRESIPLHSRFAEVLTQLVEKVYGLSTLQLALLSESEGLGYCSVHEILATLHTASECISLVGIHEINTHQLAASERSLIDKIMIGHAPELGRFARLGWLKELFDKISIHRTLDPCPIVQQLNQGVDFSLLHMRDSSHNDIWFKAVGEPNTQEYQLTVLLSNKFPTHVPRLIELIPEWNGWISEGVEGVPLCHLRDKCAWAVALSALAVMQKSASDDVEELRKAGAKDRGTRRLMSLCPSFFAEAERAMLAQVSTNAVALSREELRQLRAGIEYALDVLMVSGIPETLLHGDTGHGNVLVSQKGAVFLDWAETYVGHPFITAEHLLADCVRSQPRLAQFVSSLRRTYAAHWSQYASPSTLFRVSAFAPAVAAFAYALNAWEANAQGPAPTLVWPLLRSLLRRAKHELDLTREVCV